MDETLEVERYREVEAEQRVMASKAHSVMRFMSCCEARATTSVAAQQLLLLFARRSQVLNATPDRVE
jgi:hypothetical protein